MMSRFADGEGRGPFLEQVDLPLSDVIPWWHLWCSVSYI